MILEYGQQGFVDMVARANAIVATTEFVGSLTGADPIRSVFSAQYQGIAGGPSGPLDREQATVIFHFQVAGEGRGGIWKTVKINAGWDDSYDDLLNKLLEAADSLAENYGTEVIPSEVLDIRIY